MLFKKKKKSVYITDAPFRFHKALSLVFFLSILLLKSLIHYYKTSTIANFILLELKWQSLFPPLAYRYLPP